MELKLLVILVIKNFPPTFHSPPNAGSDFMPAFPFPWLHEEFHMARLPYRLFPVNANTVLGHINKT